MELFCPTLENTHQQKCSFDLRKRSGHPIPILNENLRMHNLTLGLGADMKQLKGTNFEGKSAYAQLWWSDTIFNNVSKS